MQSRHESESAKEAEAIANEALYAGGQSYSKENPGPNGETFSLAKPFEFPAWINRKYQARIDQWEKTGDAGREPINLGITPPVLRVAGADGVSLLVPPSLFGKVTKEAHAVPLEALRALPQSLADPVAVFQSRTRADSLVVLTEFSENGKPVIVAVTLDKQAGAGWTVNEVASMYGKTNAAEVVAMFGESPLYVNPQKSLAWSRQVGLQLPKRPTPQRGQGSIPGPDNVVKWAEVEQSKASFSLRKFNLSSQLSGAAEALRSMKAGKSFDFASVYQAAMVGQSSSMLPLERLFDEAKKQNPALTEAEFGAKIQALYHNGELLLEPGESPDAMRAAKRTRHLFGTSIM